MQVVEHNMACTRAATASAVKDKLATVGFQVTEKINKGLSDFLGVTSDIFTPYRDKNMDFVVITLMGTPSGTADPCEGNKAFTSSRLCSCLTLGSSFRHVLTKTVHIQAKKEICVCN